MKSISREEIEFEIFRRIQHSKTSESFKHRFVEIGRVVIRTSHWIKPYIRSNKIKKWLGIETSVALLSILSDPKNCFVEGKDYKCVGGDEDDGKISVDAFKRLCVVGKFSDGIPIYDWLCALDRASSSVLNDIWCGRLVIQVAKHYNDSSKKRKRSESFDSAIKNKNKGNHFV